MEASISFNKVYHPINRITSFHNLNFGVERGTIHAILSQSPSLRSIILKMAAGIILPEKGRIFINGQESARDRENIRYEIGYISCDTLIINRNSFRKNCLFAGQLFQIKEHHILSHVEEMAKFFQVFKYIDAPVSSLPEKFHLFLTIIQNTIHSPSILLFQDPFSSIDKQHFQLLKEFMIDRRHVTTIIITGDELRSVVDFSDMITLIHEGVILYHGSFHKMEHPPVLTHYCWIKIRDQLEHYRQLIPREYPGIKAEIQQGQLLLSSPEKSTLTKALTVIDEKDLIDYKFQSDELDEIIKIYTNVD